MVTCKKVYADIPFAHRQHQHVGHCNLIHGHNWSLALTFACSETDACGFVVDFGSLGYIKDWINLHLDHACLLAESDSKALALAEGSPELFKLYVLPNASSEGIAQHLHRIFDTLVREHTQGRAWIQQIEVVEDSKNSATFCPS